MTKQEHDHAINTAAAYLVIAQEVVRAMGVTNLDAYDRIRLARLTGAHTALAGQLALLEAGNLALDDYRDEPVSLDWVRQQRQRGA